MASNADLIMGAFQSAPGLVDSYRRSEDQYGATSPYQKQLAAQAQSPQGDMASALRRIMAGEDPKAVAAEMKAGGSPGLQAAPGGSAGLVGDLAGAKPFAAAMPQVGPRGGLQAEAPLVPQDQRDWRSMLEVRRSSRSHRDYMGEIEARARAASELESLRQGGREKLAGITEEGKNSRAEAGRASREGIASSRLEESGRQFDESLKVKWADIDRKRDQLSEWARVAGIKLDRNDPDLKLLEELRKSAASKRAMIGDMMKSTGLTDSQKAELLRQADDEQRQVDEAVRRVQNKAFDRAQSAASQPKPRPAASSGSSSAPYQVGQTYQTPRGPRIFKGKDEQGRNIWGK